MLTMPDVPVLRAETYYLPPPPTRRGQEPDDWSQIPGAELVYHWIDIRLHRRTPIPTQSVPDAPPVYARVDDNRWLGDCANCGAACLVSLVDLRFGCTECRRDWVALIVPADVDAIEAELIAGGPSRFWWNPDDPNNPYAPEPEPEPEPEDPQP